MIILNEPPESYFFNNNGINSTLKEKEKKESNARNDAGDGIKFLRKIIDSLELTQI